MGFFDLGSPLDKTWANFEIEEIVNTINILRSITKKSFSSQINIAKLMDYGDENTYKNRFAVICYYISFETGHKFELEFFKVLQKKYMGQNSLKKGINVELSIIKKEKLVLGKEIFITTDRKNEKYIADLKKKITYLQRIREAANEKMSEMVKIIESK
jgi:hypothetical protein